MPINESLNLSVLFGGSVKATASTTIVDTSRPAYEYILVPGNPSDTAITEIDVPTYTITANKTSLNEGESVVFTISTTMLDTGTSMNYTISGVSVDDINLNSLKGSLSTDVNGKATLTVTTSADRTTEGNETLTLSIDGTTTSLSVTVLDTSLATTYAFDTYDAATGGKVITTVGGESSSEIIIDINNTYGGTSVVDQGYYVKSTINLYQLFVATQGRVPYKNEKVSFNVASNVAIIGDNMVTPAIITSHLWDVSNVLNINNAGLISGRGGDAGSPVGYQGGNGIDGGSAILTVTNRGTIAGGGGGGGSIIGTYAGGGGAPYGIGRISDVDGHPEYSGKNAGLLVGGGPNGGDIGKPAIDMSTDILENPGLAGFISRGRVFITNIDNGKTIGA